MPELERDLTMLAAMIDWPPTPNLAARAVPVGGFQMKPGWRRLVAVAAAVALVAGGFFAYAPTRDAIAEFVNLHTIIHRVPTLETPSPRAGQRLGLGTPTTLSQAQSKLSWKIVVPPALGQPDEVYLALTPDGPSGGEVTLVYRSRPGIPQSSQTGISVLVTEARGAVDEQFFGKTVGPGTTVEAVDVSGHPGWWISGQPHVFVFTDANGNPYFDTARLATNTLLIDDGGLVVRIEGDMTKAQAIQLVAAT